MIGRLLGLQPGRGPGAAAPRNCWRVRPVRRGRAGRPRPIPAACGAGWIWRPAWSASPRCCSWTSRPPGWIRGRASRCGRPSAARRRRRHRAAHHPVPGGGRRAGRPDRGDRPRPGGGGRHAEELKARTGGQTLVVRAADRGRDRAGGRDRRGRDRRRARGQRRDRPGHRARRATRRCCRRGPAAGRGRHAAPNWRSGCPAWTRCSSP